MKRILLLSLLLFSALTLSAQAPGPYHSAVHVGIITPLSTNGKYAREYTNNFSFNGLGGISHNEKGLAFAGLYNMICNDATGVQFAGLFNTIGGEGTGIDFAGLFNTTGNYRGIQFAGVGNASDDVRGIQFAGLGNISDNVQGIQFGGLVNISDQLVGLQFAGLSNITDNVTGLQFAGLGNISDDVRGLQFAGLGNVTGDIRGMQFAGIGNIAGNVKGFQFAGIFNKVKKARGVQFAGLFNIAEESDYPFALLNFIRNGEKSIGLKYNEVGNITVDFRSGGRYTYGIVGLGYNARADKDAFVMEAGYGARFINRKVFRLSAEAIGSYIGGFNERGTIHGGLSLLPSVRLGHFEVFAGPSINAVAPATEHSDLAPCNYLWKRNVPGHTRIGYIYVGYTAGVSFIF